MAPRRTMAQGAAFQHAELVALEGRVIAGAVEMPVPGHPLLISMGGADRAAQVQHGVLQAVAVMEPVDPLTVETGQRRTVLGQGLRLGLEPPQLRGRGRLCIDGTAVGVIPILISGQPPEHRLLEQSAKPMDRIPAPSGVAQCCYRQIGRPSAASSSHITRRPPSELSCVRRNSTRTRGSKSIRSACCELAPSG